MWATIFGFMYRVAYSGASASNCVLSNASFSPTPPIKSPSGEALPWALPVVELTENAAALPPWGLAVITLHPLDVYGLLGRTDNGLISWLIIDQTFCPYTIL